MFRSRLRISVLLYEGKYGKNSVCHFYSIRENSHSHILYIASKEIKANRLDWPYPTIIPTCFPFTSRFLRNVPTFYRKLIQSFPTLLSFDGLESKKKGYYLVIELTFQPRYKINAEIPSYRVSRY